MAVVNSSTTEYAAIASLATGAHAPLKPSQLGGRLRAAYFNGTSVAADATSVISLTKVPAGARIIALYFACQDLGAATSAIEFGDAGDPDRLVSAFDVGTAAVAYSARTLRTPGAAEPDLGFGYIYTTETVITATISVASQTAGGLYWGCILYVVD